MKLEKNDNYRVPSTRLVKLVQMGNVSKIVALEHKNNFCPIKRVNKDECINLKTGELIECNHTESRCESIDTVRHSVSKLRDIINANFVGRLK